MSIEIRCLNGELRTSGTRRITGYAAVFGQLSELIGGQFREKIRYGAFSRSISGSADVRALLNHDANLILGRTTAGTLQLIQDGHGLMYTVSLPDNTTGRDLFESIRRGDITQSSFGFTTNKDEWSKSPDGQSIRELLDVTLFDVSPVTYPAYPQTSVGLRGKEIGCYRSNGVVIPKAEPSEDDREKLRLMLELAKRLK